MAGLLRLLVVIALIWVAVTYGWPRVKRFLDDPKVVTSVRSGDDGLGCVQAASRMLSTFENGIAEVSAPPFEETKWESFRERVRDRQDQAQAACGCVAEPCAIAREALDDFDSLMMRFNTELRRGSYPSEAAGELSDIQALLDRARGAVI